MNNNVNYNVNTNVNSHVKHNVNINRYLMIATFVFFIVLGLLVIVIINENKSEINVKSIQIIPKNVTLELGDTETVNLVVEYTPSNATDKIIKEWKSSNPTVATINEKGIVNAISPGSTIITAVSQNGQTATCHILVNPNHEEPTGITLNYTGTIELEIDGELFLSASLIPEAVKDTLTWTSSDLNIVSVDNDGKVTAKKEGVAIITATTSNNLSTSVTIKVNKKKIEVTGVSFNKTNIQLKVNETFQLNATVSPVGADTSITWMSSNTKVATVDNNGKVTAKSSGSTTITAKTANGKVATCIVNVLSEINLINFSWNNGYEKKLGGGAARVYPLPNGTLIGAYESNSNIYTKISSDNGSTWSEAVLAASLEGLNCANINFYYYSNTLYMAYRATKKVNNGAYTSLHVSKSIDYGKICYLKDLKKVPKLL